MRLLLTALSGALLSTTFLLAQERVADQFEFPVGVATAPPVEAEGNLNGFRITQHFDTSSKYEGGEANGAWCATHDFSDEIEEATSRVECIQLGSDNKWVFGHSGNDLSNRRYGAPVRAIANGEVVHAGRAGGYGNMVKIRHRLPDGAIVFSIYGHLNDIVVTSGNVDRGDTIGHVGSDGAGTNAHLHFALYGDRSAWSEDQHPPGYVYYDAGLATPYEWLGVNSLAHMHDALLFVDDRRDRRTIGMACCGSPTPLFFPTEVLGKTMSIENTVEGTTTSVREALARGWLEDRFGFGPFVQSLGFGWLPAPGAENYLFYPDSAQMGLIARTAGLRLHYFVPGNQYLRERARDDMRVYARAPSTLAAYRELYFELPGSFSLPGYGTAMFRISGMYFLKWNGTQLTGVVVLLHGYSLSRPLVRVIATYENGVFTPWTSVF